MWSDDEGENIDALSLSVEDMYEHTRLVRKTVHSLRYDSEPFGRISTGMQFLTAEQKLHKIAAFLARLDLALPGLCLHYADEEAARTYIYEKFPSAARLFYATYANLAERVRAAKCPEAYLPDAVFEDVVSSGLSCRSEWPLIRNSQVCVNGWDLFFKVTGVRSEFDVPQETADVLTALTCMNQQHANASMKLYYISLDALELHESIRERANKYV